MTDVMFSEDADAVIRRMDCGRLGRSVAIKVHFGEEGCVTYIDPAIVRKVYEKVVSTGRKASLVECNVLYKGSRTVSSDHIRTAKAHGFGFAPIDILDGEHGQEHMDVRVGGFTAKLGAGLRRYDSMVVVSHFKGHVRAGFGGALKNVGMGLGSRAGKLHMHSDQKHSIGDECVGCGVCVENCGAGAIALREGTPGKGRVAEIDPSRCVGCAMCFAVCRNGAVKVPWHGSTPERLQEKIARYAGAVMEVIPRDRIVFINVLRNVTEGCDCMGAAQKPMMEDVGLLMSGDIVAIDAASLGLANRLSGGKFGKINGIDKRHQIECAHGMGLGEKDYRVVPC
jgi:uncharacterized Fe-S center protein